MSDLSWLHGDTPDWALTVMQWCHRHPDRLARDHYRCVLDALLDGHDVPDRVLQEYPNVYEHRDDVAELRKLRRKWDSSYKRYK